MHRHALRPSSGPEPCHKDDGTHDLRSRSCGLISNLHQQPNIIDAPPFLEVKHRASTAVGGHSTQSQLRHSSRQVLYSTLLVGGVLRHTSEQRENAVSSALRQDSIYPSRDSTIRKFCSLPGKLNSLSKAVVPVRLHLWPLHRLMRQ